MYIFVCLALHFFKNKFINSAIKEKDDFFIQGGAWILTNVNRWLN